MSERDLDKRNKMAAMGITLASVIILVGIGVAFFAASVSNANNERLSTQTATMSLEFDDNDNGVSGTLNLGQSIIKKFTLENTGTVDASGKISWYNLVNTYTADSLSWTLEQSTTENGTYTSIGTGLVPTSTTATTQTLKDRIIVPVNTTYYYKLTITLNNLDIDQSSDINASMHSQFSLQEGTPPQLATTTMENLVSGASTSSTNVINAASVSSSCTNTLAYDGTTDNNLRYVGANPCNYVSFNNESTALTTLWDLVDPEETWQYFFSSFSSEQDCLDAYDEDVAPNGNYTYGEDLICRGRALSMSGWRIIGLMNNVDDGTGNMETRIKLIRSKPLGDYIWDENYVNDWSKSDIMGELNGDYLDTTLQTDPNWVVSEWSSTPTFDHTQVLNQTAQTLIGNAKWHLGGTDEDEMWDYNNTGEGTASKFYGYERGNNVWGSTAGQTCNDGACPRATSWVGKVALPYPSDYGFSVGGSVRSTCLNEIIGNYSNDDCIMNQWMHPYNSLLQWPDMGEFPMISPRSDSSSNIILIRSSIDFQGANSLFSIKPTIYLKANVKIINGDGSPENPFILGF